MESGPSNDFIDEESSYSDSKPEMAPLCVFILLYVTSLDDDLKTTNQKQALHILGYWYAWVISGCESAKLYSRQLYTCQLHANEQNPDLQ